ncbi:coumaroyl-CoA:anthocyanidin 3-O-glucoside-6''-O-coumaroyltransferase 2-like [Argentina anserina]|uniref:coumaroyl-CoA:anthocyanidin 3-O-glucoside-6''-O-coumaroyltransferase 2-like n=1 Tax=Argentina anserina TaxID=57926 RepID=UPI0021763B92|nr:coumaroyl-CoA:anthocyanidin 3-O-glucoside-6''-O-coumaroyltransferase 2-like [Potentilla anserina]
MNGSCSSVKVIEQCQISPPPGSVPTTPLPLTFFDFVFLFPRPNESVFSFEFPHPLNHFTQCILPKLKYSLSLTLQHFFPLASNLKCPPPPSKPYIQYTAGGSLPLTIAESSGDFNRLTSNRVEDIEECHLLIPALPPASVLEDGTRVAPLLAVQITVFPDSGICIGTNCDHVLADESSFHHFLKFWASVCRVGGADVKIESLPCHNRGLIKDTFDLKNKFLDDWRRWSPNKSEPSSTPLLIGKVRTTFELRRDQIHIMKLWVSNLFVKLQGSKPAHISSFVVVCAFAWVSMVKTEETTDDDMQCRFNFAADCRDRLGYPLPRSYFGNCLSLRSAQAMKSELVGENGIVAAVNAIGNNVKDLENGVLRGAEDWTAGWLRANSNPEHFTTLAGSPRFDFYNELDFGWGRPKKCEVINVDFDRCIYVSNSRDDEGGVEILLALKREQMDCFSSIFNQALEFAGVES